MTIKNFGVVSGPGDGNSGNIWQQTPSMDIPTGYFFQNVAHISCNLCQTESTIATFRAAGTDVTNCFIDLNGGFLATLTIGSNMTLVKGEMVIDRNLTGLANAIFTGTITSPTISQINADIASNKSLASSKKSFDIPHPSEKNKRLRHVCIEGPEAAVYTRGKIEGTNIIHLPEYWRDLVDTETISVHLTPIGSYQELFFKEIKWGNQIKIQNNAGGHISCYYTVTGVRKDVSVVIPEYEGLTPGDYPGDNDEYIVNAD
jgi:hypothetical protein